jgi:integrase/recombinase XerD
MSGIRTFFGFLLKQGLRTDNPAKSVRTAYKRRKRASLPLGVLAEKALLLQQETGAYGSLRNHMILELVFRTPIRFLELSALNIGDVDMSGNCLRIGADMRIPLNTETMRQMTRYISCLFLYRNAAIDTPLFANRNGQRMTRQGFWNLIKKAAKDAGMAENIAPIQLRESMSG